MRVLITGMGGELGTRLANQLGADAEGRGRHGPRHRSAPPAPPGRVPPGRPPRPRAGRAADPRLRADGAGAPRRLRALRPQQPPLGGRAHRGRHAHRGHRVGRRRLARSHRGALGHRGLRPSPSGADATRRGRPPRPDQPVRPSAAARRAGLRRGRAARRHPGDQAALRAAGRAVVPEPARPLPAHARGAVPGARRPAVLDAAPGRRGRRPCSPRCAARTTARSTWSAAAR